MPGRKGAPAGKALETVEAILAQTRGEADVRYISERWTTLRFANSRIYQPQEEERDYVSLRVFAEGGRIGTATTADLTTEGLSAMVRWASGMAKHSPKMKAFKGLPEDSNSPTPAAKVSNDVLKGRTGEKAGEFPAAMDLIEETIAESRVAGVYNEGVSSMTVANTSGLRRSSRRTLCQASILVENIGMDPPVSGWAEAASWDPKKVNMISLAREALERTPTERAKQLKPGSYRTLLSSPAAAELMNMSAYGGLGAFSVEEGWSFLVRNVGKKLISPRVTIADDPLNTSGIPEAIDYDGTPTSRRLVFDSGRATGPAHDTLTAQRFGAKSTANASPPEAPFGQYGPLPRHLTMEPGEVDDEELLKELGTGVLVTRLHYVRFVNRKKTIITGMTRDGTYWVEKGEIKWPVTNMRFTDSILSVLGGAELLGSELRCCADERAVFAPVVTDFVTKGMTFNSATTF